MVGNGSEDEKQRNEEHVIVGEETGEARKIST